MTRINNESYPYLVKLTPPHLEGATTHHGSLF